MKVLITGGSGGLGKAIHAELYDNPGVETITTIGRDGCDHNVDFADPDQLAYVVARYLAGTEVVIHAAGANCIAPHNQLVEGAIQSLVQVNALSNFTIVRELLHKGLQVSCSVISDAAWTPMTHSLAYNVSKAAQLMVMRQMAHEIKDAIIFGVSPGKIANTGMSEYIDNTFPQLRGLTYDQGRTYQLSRLKTGEMEPKTVARFITGLVMQASKHMHGQNYIIGG